MRDQILKFDEQFLIGIEKAGSLKYKKPLDRVIIAGIGGSKIAGEILSMLSPEIRINRDYELPEYVSSDWLVICISWSGNTAETISSFHAAKLRGAEVLIITSGGKLAQIAEETGTPLVLLPNNNTQPRASVGFMTAVLFSVLDIGEKFDFEFDQSKLESNAQDIAEKIGAKYPIIYTTQKWNYLGSFWKILFNENDKIPAFYNTFPELVHNELAFFNQKKSDAFYFVILRDATEDTRQLANIDNAIAILAKLGYSYTIVSISGKTFLEKVFDNYLLGLWVTYYLAKPLGVEPDDMSSIEEFKKMNK